MDRKNRTVMVVGLGRFGASIARTLSEDGVQVLGIDRRMDLVESLQQELTQAVQADSMDRETLHMLGAGDFDTAFVTIGGDLKASCADYVALQKAQGLPFADYGGQTVCRYTFRLTNYPGGRTDAQANLLLCGSDVIAGDVMLLGADGGQFSLAFPK